MPRVAGGPLAHGRLDRCASGPVQQDCFCAPLSTAPGPTGVCLGAGLPPLPPSLKIRVGNEGGPVGRGGPARAGGLSRLRSVPHPLPPLSLSRGLIFLDKWPGAVQGPKPAVSTEPFWGLLHTPKLPSAGLGCGLGQGGSGAQWWDACPACKSFRFLPGTLRWGLCQSVLQHRAGRTHCRLQQQRVHCLGPSQTSQLACVSLNAGAAAGGGLDSLLAAMHCEV